MQTKTDAELKQIQAQVAAGPTEPQIARLLGGYWGSHQFTLTGGAAVDYIYDHKLNQNTFTLDFEPIMLYRPTDWLAFEGTFEAAYDPGSGASFDAPVATAQIFLNDYMEAVLGIFDQPFGDFYETQGPFWVNRFITAPLPYGSAALVPPTDIGMQLRGAYQWGQLGQDADYTVWAANGPSYDSDLPEPVVGQALNGSTNITTNTNGKAYGGRFRIYPFPLDSNLGRLELGASTYNGKWQDGLWLNAWGVDFAYLLGNLQTRGAWISAYRQMSNTYESSKRTKHHPAFSRAAGGWPSRSAHGSAQSDSVVGTWSRGHPAGRGGRLGGHRNGRDLHSRASVMSGSKTRPPDDHAGGHRLSRLGARSRGAGVPARPAPSSMVEVIGTERGSTGEAETRAGATVTTPSMRSRRTPRSRASRCVSISTPRESWPSPSGASAVPLVDLGDPCREASRRPVALQPLRRSARELPKLLIPFLSGSSSQDVADCQSAERREPHEPSTRRLIADVTALAAESATRVAPAATPERTRVDRSGWGNASGT